MNLDTRDLLESNLAEILVLCEKHQEIQEEV